MKDGLAKFLINYILLLKFKYIYFFNFIVTLFMLFYTLLNNLRI